MAELCAFQYRVFLSFSHRDKTWGKWLQDALEGYRIDQDMVGRETAAGAVPKTLRPIFRDREDFSDGDALTERTLAALQASEYLVVLCSPNAAASRHVNEEIRRFKALGRAERVIPVIVAGNPGDPERECFPPALHYRLEPARRPPRLRIEPFVTDARLERDGKELATQKVVARLLGLGLHDVHRHAEQARKRQIRIRRNSVIAALLALTLAYDGGLAFARYELAGNEALLDRTLARATALASSAVAMARQLGLPPGLSLGFLAEAEDRVRDLAGLGREMPQLSVRKASMLIEFARNYAALGDNELQRARATEAERLLQRLAAEVPGNLNWQRELAEVYDQLGEVLLAQDRLEPALASYRAHRAVAVRLAAVEPDNEDRQRALAVSTIKVGNVHLAQGLLDEAFASYDIGFAIGERLAAADRGNARRQHDLLLAQQKIGDVLRLQGELDAALARYRSSRAIAERLIAADPGNAEWQRGLAAAQVKIGDVLALAERPDEALASYRAGQAVAARFAAADPGDAQWQNDLGLSHERIGAALEAGGDFDAALAEYRASLAVAGRLAAADPVNAGRQRELAVAHERIGDLLRARGDLGGARRHYEAKKAIVGRRAAVDSGNAGWQYDLGTSHARIGFVLEAGGDYAAALPEYEACLAIVRRFALADPDNAGSQRDLAVSHDRLAATYHRLGKTAQALAELRQGRDIMAALLRTAPEVERPALEQWTAELARFDGRIAALQGRATLTAMNPLTVASASATLRLPQPAPARAPTFTVKFTD